MIKPLIVCGIEIELEYDIEKIGKIGRRGYHNDFIKRSDYCWVSNKFIAESDRSIEVRKFANRGDVTELVSLPFELNNWEATVDAFIQYFSQYGDLKDVIHFNETTGAHVHISLLKPNAEAETKIPLRKNLYTAFHGTPIMFRNGATYEFLNNMFVKLKANVSKEMPGIYEKWAIDLNRGHYSAPLSPVLESMINNRGQEWNLTKITDIECRAFHLHGIETWDDLKKIYKIFFENLRDAVYEEYGKEKPFYHSEGLLVQEDMKDDKAKVSHRRYAIPVAKTLIEEVL